jgi:hypothetical protein
MSISVTASTHTRRYNRSQHGQRRRPLLSPTASSPASEAQLPPRARLQHLWVMYNTAAAPRHAHRARPVSSSPPSPPPPPTFSFRLSHPFSRQHQLGRVPTASHTLAGATVSPAGGRGRAGRRAGRAGSALATGEGGTGAAGRAQVRRHTRSRGTSLLCRSDHVGAPPLQVSRHLMAPDARHGWEMATQADWASRCHFVRPAHPQPALNKLAVTAPAIRKGQNCCARRLAGGEGQALLLGALCTLKSIK